MGPFQRGRGRGRGSMTAPPSKPSMAKVQQVLRILSQNLSEARRARLDNVARKRSTHVALLLENITDFGNRNAALRTMEALGFQTVHSVIEPGTRSGKKLSTRTDAGARRWLTVRDWKCTKDCVQHLRAAGYRVASSQLNASKTLHGLSLQHKTVIAFGNEHSGISKELEELSDDSFSLPMWGLVQSYNVSVAVAITLFHCRSELLNVRCNI